MRNSRYIESAITELREEGALPRELDDWTNSDILGFLKEIDEKAEDIARKRDVDVPLELDNETLMVGFKLAHDRNLTFNELIEEILERAIDEANAKLDGTGESAFKLMKNGVAWDYSDCREDVEKWRDKVLGEEPDAEVEIVEVSMAEMMDWKQS